MVLILLALLCFTKKISTLGATKKLMNITMKKIIFFSFFLLLLATSCSKQENFTSVENVEVIELENGLVFRRASLINQEIQFSLFDDEGEEITENVIYFVDGEEITGNTYQSAVEGQFEIYAQFQVNGATVETETESFSVIVPKKKPVIEDYTGTWCGYCPGVNAAIDEILTQQNNISVVAIHNGDDLSLPFEQTLRDGLEVAAGSPRARIDRTISWGSLNNYPLNSVLDIIDTPVPTAIAIKSNISNSTLYTTISIASESDLTDKKLVVYLVEDGIERDQTNYFNNDTDSPYYQLGNPIVDFVHNHTLRASLSSILGDAIPNTPALTDVVLNYSYEIPNEFVKENLHLVVMVVAADNTAINSQNALVGVEKSYE